MNKTCATGLAYYLAKVFSDVCNIRHVLFMCAKGGPASIEAY